MRAPRHGQAALGVVGVDLIAVSVEAVGEPRVDGQGPRCVRIAVVVGADVQMQAIVGEAVRRGHHDVERISLHVGGAPAEGHGILFKGDKLPERALAVAVDGVAALMLVDRQRVGLAFEGVFAILDAVRERDEQLAVAAGHHVIRTGGDDDVLALVGQFAQRRAQLGDDGMVIAMRNGKLLSGAWRQIGAGHKSLHSVVDCVSATMLPLTMWWWMRLSCGNSADEDGRCRLTAPVP